MTSSSSLFFSNETISSAVSGNEEKGEVFYHCMFWLTALGIYLFVVLLSALIYRHLLPRSGVSRHSLTRKRRSRLISDDMEITESKLEVTCWTISFKDETAEAEWQEQAFASQVPQSVSVLVWVGVAITFYLIVHLCTQRQTQTTHADVLADSLAILFAVCTTMAACYWAESSPAWVYWCLLVLYFANLPAVQLPPFAASCQVVGEKRQLLFDNKNLTWGLWDATIRHTDCTLEGHSSMLMLMTWILLQPWVLPHYEYMHVLWLWIFFLGACDTAYTYVGKGNVYEKNGAPLFDARAFQERGLILALTLVLATHKKFTLEKSRRLKFLQVKQHRASSFKIYEILNYMMPQHVVFKLMRKERIAEPLEKVSILFVVIADFDVLTQDKTPSELLNFLNYRFRLMDDICRENKVTKIETVCEEYVAAVGVLPDDVEDNKRCGHGPLLGRLFDAAGEILLHQSQEKVNYKMGIHTGPCFAGVIGTKLPRYRLFGDTMNTAARMMQKGVLGHLQFGQETYNLLPKVRKSQVSGPRDVEMKGKGIVKAYTFKPPDGAVARNRSARYRTATNLDQMTRKASILQQLKESTDVQEMSLLSFQEANPAVERNFKEREKEATERTLTWELWWKWFVWFHTVGAGCGCHGGALRWI